MFFTEEKKIELVLIFPGSNGAKKNPSSELTAIERQHCIHPSKIEFDLFCISRPLENKRCLGLSGQKSDRQNIYRSLVNAGF
ncbi:MAG: hypothetical protein ACFBSE_15585 [Prochloraceae cyanobacterium]